MSMIVGLDQMVSDESKFEITELLDEIVEKHVCSFSQLMGD